MPQIFGSGEVAQRLRRLLDFRGRFPGQIDETIVPVIQVEDARRAPFRRSGRRWWTHFPVTAAATTGAGSFLINETGTTIVVDYLTIGGNILLETGGNSVLLGTRVGEPSVIQGGLRLNAITTEAGDVPSGTLPSSTDLGTELLAMYAIGYTTSVIGSQLGTTMARWWLAGAGAPGVQGQPGLPNGINLLGPEYGIALSPRVALGIETFGTQANHEFEVTWGGLYWDDVLRGAPQG